MHRQPSRNTTHMDTIECNADTDDLVLENELSKREHDYRRSRRDESYKRSNEISTHHSKYHSPSSVTYKRHSSPPLVSSSSRSHHNSSQKHHRTSSPSSPPPLLSSAQSSSRHHRSTRPVVSTKRSHPRSESPYERRPPNHRSRPELSTERTIADALTFIASGDDTKTTSKQETTDKNLIPVDESNKIHHSRSNSNKTNDSSSMINDNKIHSTPSVPIPQTMSNESLLEMSNISQECELSLYPRSTLSTTNTSSISMPTINSASDMMHTMDLISRYNAMQTTLSKTPQTEALSKDILMMIQKHIELQKIELDNREKEIKLRQYELAEQEKRINTRSSEPIISVTPISSEPSLITKPNVIEDITQIKPESSITHDIVNISPDESVVSSIPPNDNTSKITVAPKTLSTQSSVTRKTRFSQLVVDPSIFASTQQKPVLELYSDDLEAPSETIPSTISADLKITSSSTCRKVEIQSGIIDKPNTNKDVPKDLRLTLVKNRAKQSNNHDEQQHQTSNENELNNDQQSIININDNQQQSYDYQQQRNFTSNEPIIDNNHDRRNVRHHRQQYSSSTNNNPNERSYKQGSSRYSSNQKRYDNDDRPPRSFDYGRSKASRPPHKTNY